MESARMSPRGVLIAVVTVLTLAILAGIVVWVIRQDGSGSAPADVVRSQSLPVDELRTGYCVDQLPPMANPAPQSKDSVTQAYTSADRITVVPCRESHRAEVIHTFDASIAWPGASLMSIRSGTDCAAEFARRGTREHADLMTLALYPGDEQTFTARPRQLCLVQERSGGQLTGRVFD